MADGAAQIGTVGHCTLLGRLGDGGSGTVYLAEQAPLRRRVALKILHATAAGAEPEFRSRVEREAAALGALRHPGLAGLIESGWTPDGRFFLVLEYVDGPELLRHAEAAGLSRRERVQLLARVCDAVDHAHRRGVVHGDLKPANIRVDASGAPRVLDFEPARPRQVGTPAWLAPEQARGAAATELSDVHALGLLLYELLAGRPARDLSGLAPAEALARVALAREPATDASRRLPGPLRAIVDKATDAVPSRRYASAAALADDLRRHLAALPLAARPSGALARGLLFSRRHRVPVALTGIVLASLVTALVLMLVFTRIAARATAELLQLNADVRTLSDKRVLDELERRVEAELLPATPERAPAMEAWLREAHELDARPAWIRDLLKRPEFALAPDDGTPVERSAGRLLRSDFEELLAYLERFFDPVRGSVAVIEARLDASLRLPGLTVSGRSDDWLQCLDSVAHNPLYGGLELVPQVGLVPLGDDALSHCAEFAVWGTGEMPLRDPATGTLRPPRAEDAIVLVLIPGGVHRLYAEALFEPKPTARPTTPPVEYSLRAPPFLIGKYEITQAQWERLTGSRPSAFRPGWSTGRQPAVDGTHPVENLSLELAQAGLRRIGMIVSPADLWEVAARGGDGLCGAELGLEVLECAANVSDLVSRLNSLHPWTSPDQFQLDDGYEIHAPVGSFRPNGYGLHDTLGNVDELCTGRGPGGRVAATKGCSYRDLPMHADPAFAQWFGVTDAGPGLRPVRWLDDLGPAGDGR